MTSANSNLGRMEESRMLVPYFSFKDNLESIRGEWLSEITKVLDSGVFINGPYKELFEKRWASTINSKYATGVGNGLDGLVLALKSLEIGEGKIVAVPSHTFIATWNAVELAGAKVFGIDVDANGLIDLDILENLDMKVDAVIPVHMHGLMVDMERLCGWAAKRNVKIIEDASQAHLAQQAGKYAGTWGDIGVFSLYPTKNLGALGDAGVVVTDSKNSKDRLNSLSNYGSNTSNKYKHEIIGFNSRLDEIQAACLIVNLEKLFILTERRREIARNYLMNVTNPGIKFLNNKMDEANVWHHMPIISNTRDSLRKYLQLKQIGTEIHYPFAAGSEYLQIKKSTEQEFPNADKLSQMILSLPNHPWMTDDQVDYVVEALNSYNE